MRVERRPAYAPGSGSPLWHAFAAAGDLAPPPSRRGRGGELTWGHTHTRWQQPLAPFPLTFSAPPPSPLLSSGWHRGRLVVAFHYTIVLQASVTAPFSWPAPAPAAGAPAGGIPLQQARHIGPDPYLARVMLPSDGANPEEGHLGGDDEALVPPTLREVVAAIPRRLARPEHQTRWSPAGDFDRINVAANAAERLKRHRFEYIETQAGEATPASPLYRLWAQRPYWLATMQQIWLVSALSLRVSIITDGCGLDWDPVKGPAPPVFLPNLPSGRTEAAFVAEAVAAGVTAGIMQPCMRGDLICVLPLGVAFNRASKRQLI